MRTIRRTGGDIRAESLTVLLLALVCALMVAGLLAAATLLCLLGCR